MIDISSKNYYQLLGVSRRASTEEIRDAYKDIARIYHPDSTFYSEIVRIDLTPEDAEVFRVITNAYTVLSHPERREKYDKTLPPAPSDDDGEYYDLSDEDLVRQSQDVSYEWRELVPTHAESSKAPSRNSATYQTFGILEERQLRGKTIHKSTVSRGRTPTIHDMISERKRRIRNRVITISVIASVVLGSGIASLILLLQ